MQPITITAADGYRLSATYFEGHTSAPGTIVISSATGVKKEFYLNFARYLVRKGYTVLLYDYRGIGGSAPRRLKTSKAYMHEWGTKDMNAVLNWLVAEKSCIDIIWIGHSIGGQLFGFLEKKQHLKKVITVNAGLGYWGNFAFPMNIKIGALWYIVAPLLITIHGYGSVKKLGWGEDLPGNVLREWRKWCINKNYFMALLQKKLNARSFHDFNVPITAVYTNDDFIATDKTIARMMEFFPNAPIDIIKIPVSKYTHHKAGHTGLFRKRFENSLWPLLAAMIDNKETVVQHSTFTSQVFETIEA